MTIILNVIHAPQVLINLTQSDVISIIFGTTKISFRISPPITPMFRQGVRNILGRTLNRGFSTAVRQPLRSSFFTRGAAVGTTVALSAVALSYNISNDNQIESADSINNTVSVDSSINAFPRVLVKSPTNELNADYTLLGYGVRTVTFVLFKVYGIGLYIAQADVNKAQKILGSLGSKDDVRALLSDHEKSVDVVDKLLTSGVRFLVRINPIRNTDFNHMKDGLVKSVLSHPISKENRDTVGEGLDQLRNAFQGHRGSFPKNDLLYLESQQDGKLRVLCQNKEKVTLMGEVKEPLVSRVLLLLYTSGKKPLSEPLRKNTVEGMLRL